MILNGAPRSGKSSIAAAMQDLSDEPWVNLGVDAQNRTLPEKLLPGIGLRPGGERPDLEPVVRRLYSALYASVAAHSREGFNVVVDVGHHHCYLQDLDVWRICARHLKGLRVLLVGVCCPLEEIMQRRSSSQPGREALYLQIDENGAVPEPILRWQEAVHKPDIYDLEIDSSVLTPQEAAQMILAALPEYILPGALNRHASN
ncbi:chloramphenicol phosphotransferase CPT family protein [Qingshengfaniella alkalisoli]|uniref:chloramphenicol phosphotransferase CPT family protein n=1 Tax=Qingshengfaniella alkalisoli TaxID=2599296 RepID=UPI001F0E7C35|nr:hypothetical protein [Qingshengfaniella alkalisoli]